MSMKKFEVGRLGQRPVLTVEGETIRRAIFNFAEMADVGIHEKRVHKEEYAFVTFRRFDKISVEMLFFAVD